LSLITKTYLKGLDAYKEEDEIEYVGVDDEKEKY
jgi:hypothetical protein